MNKPMKKLLIAATHSGAGKTTITLGIMRALYQRGVTVQPYKVGPDYIDTGWHQLAANRASRNLDTFMLTENTLNALFSQAAESADINIIEGVMGLFDGFGLQADYCSSAGIAKQLDCPVILVVDGKGVSTSLAATVQGFSQFMPDIQIAAVIINRVNSDSHYQILKKAIEYYCQIPVIGRLPVMSELALPSRHLGLIPSQEKDNQQMQHYWQQLVEAIEQYVDLDKLMQLAEREKPAPLSMDLSAYCDLSGITIAVAKDEAFHFYYQDNLDLLMQLGVTLVEFSPLNDAELPDCQAIYIGGGFPEMFAERLAKNQAMREALLNAHHQQIPIYAECGGLMYLGENLIDLDGNTHQMVGILSGYSKMSKGLKRFGYAQAEAKVDTLIVPKGHCLRGHEFHHSEFFTELPTCFAMTKERDGEVISNWQGGYQVNNTFASYLHLHFYQTPEIINCWLGQIKHD